VNKITFKSVLDYNILLNLISKTLERARAL